MRNVSEDQPFKSGREPALGALPSRVMENPANENPIRIEDTLRICIVAMVILCFSRSTVCLSL